MPEHYEHVTLPLRKHLHTDGSRCVLTSRGRWMVECAGISDEAECQDPEATV